MSATVFERPRPAAPVCSDSDSQTACSVAPWPRAEGSTGLATGVGLEATQASNATRGCCVSERPFFWCRISPGPAVEPTVMVLHSPSVAGVLDLRQTGTEANAQKVHPTN